MTTYRNQEPWDKYNHSYNTFSSPGDLLAQVPLFLFFPNTEIRVNEQLT